jgi:hypothetical protein
MPFWAAHTTVSSTTSAGSQRIGQDAMPSCPGLAIDRSLREGPLDQPGGFSRICGLSRDDAALQGTGRGFMSLMEITGNSTAGPAGSALLPQLWPRITGRTWTPGLRPPAYCRNIPGLSRPDRGLTAPGPARSGRPS